MRWNVLVGVTATVVLGWGGQTAAQGFDHSHVPYRAVLTAHVQDGLVDYRSLKASPEALEHYLDTLAAVSRAAFQGWTEAQQMAFLTNLYNAATLKLVVDRYPVDSIRDIRRNGKGPWDQEVVRLFGSAITLNKLEHGILRKDYNEPRLHMALVCAAKGCPPLRSEPYTAEQLDEQLDDQSRVFLDGPLGLQIDPGKGEARVSAIFKWYEEDFASVRAFLEKHGGRSLEGLTIRYLDYDWSLNEP